MTFVSLWLPAWPIDAATSVELGRRALAVAPRIRLEPAQTRLWADVRGLDGGTIATALVALAESTGVSGARAGVAFVPIVAQVAARIGAEPVTAVAMGQERDFLAPLDLEWLDPPPEPFLYPLLAAVGIGTCGELAALDPQSVEIRFGAEGVRVWKLARADDPRPIFGPREREWPSAELEWVDYELANQEQVVFIVNSLLATVTDALAVRREGAHAMTLEFTLADRSQVAVPVHCSHPTADRKTWLRVTRAALEPVTFAAAVTRIALGVEAAAALVDRQGDLFDAGFATARATEAALGQLLDKQADAIVVAHRTRHPLPERRIEWRPDPTGQLGDQLAERKPTPDLVPRLTMQLLPAPQTIDVWVVTRRGHPVPDRYFDGTRNYSLSASLGPDRVSGGIGERGFERDYFQGIRQDGVMVLLYRDVATDLWYLAGWWD